VSTEAILSNMSEVAMRDDRDSSAVRATRSCGEQQAPANAFRYSVSLSFLLTFDRRSTYACQCGMHARTRTRTHNAECGSALRAVEKVGIEEHAQAPQRKRLVGRRDARVVDRRHEQ
jgi:hypothetical protein